MSLFHVLKQRRARVLFVCLGNSYRSRMAETFANAYGSDVVEAGSAGFMPARNLSQTARRLMFEKGLALSDALPRSWSTAELDKWDVILNMCEFGLPKTSVLVLKTPFPDPVGRPEEERREIRDEIEILVQVMLAQFRQVREEWPWNIEPAPDSPETDSEDCAPESETTVSWWTKHPANVQSPLADLPA
jgi:arsenate reductase